MKESNILILLLMGILIMPVIAQDDLNVYQSFHNSGQLDFSFFKDIPQKIIEARKQKDARSLCLYAALLFYAENITSQKNSQVEGIALLREATLIAWKNENIATLEAIKAVWGSKLFGQNNLSGAQAIEKFIQTLKAKAFQPEQPSVSPSPLVIIQPSPERPSQITYDPQAFLLAEEQARLDAMQQVAETIFGVMIQSLTEVKDFVVQKDVVISKLKESLLAGATFSEAQAEGDEVHVIVTVSQKSVLGSMERLLSSQGKKMSSSEKSRLEKSLKSEYRATGIGVMQN